MNRAAKIGIGALVLALIVAIGLHFFLTGSRDPVAVSGSPNLPSATPRPAPQAGLEHVLGPNQRENLAGLPDTHGETVPAKVQPEQPSFSGWFEFADGSRPPEMNFEIIAEPLPAGASIAELVAESERSEAANACRHWAAYRTEADGQFSVERLFAGSYRIELSSLSGLGQIDGTFVVPAKNIALPLPGYLLRIRTVSDDEKTLSGALVTCEYSMDSHIDSADAPLHLSSTSDAAGNAMFCLPEEGECTLRASAGSRVSAALRVTARGPSFQSVSTLVLRAGAEASLRVSIHGCDAPAAAVTDYCIKFLDERQLATVFRLCSETAEQPGVFRHLPPGRYFAEAVPRYSGPAAFYFADSPPKRIPIVLTGNQISDLDFCVQLGGRISVVVRTEEPLSSGATTEAKVEMGEPNAVQHKPVQFREPTATGVTISVSLPVDVLRVSEAVMKPGSYDLIISAAGFEAVRKSINVYAGEVSPVECVLKRKP